MKRAAHSVWNCILTRLPGVLLGCWRATAALLFAQPVLPAPDAGCRPGDRQGRRRRGPRERPRARGRGYRLNIPPQLTGDAKRDTCSSYLTDIMLVAKAAEAKKIADDARFKRRLAFIRNKLLMESLLQTEGKAAVTDAGDAQGL